MLSNNLKISFQKTNYIKFVHKLTNKYTNNGDTTYDPFFGRGTTLLKSRLLKWKVHASDLNPLSFVFTKAKSHNLDKNQIIKTITKLLNMNKCIVLIK